MVVTGPSFDETKKIVSRRVQSCSLGESRRQLFWEIGLGLDCWTLRDGREVSVFSIVTRANEKIQPIFVERSKD